jgi:hypothetical protein
MQEWNSVVFVTINTRDYTTDETPFIIVIEREPERILLA